MTVYRGRPPGTDDGRSRKPKQAGTVGQESEVLKMSEKEKQILEIMTKAIPNMSEFSKGYLLGMGEAMVSNKKQESKEEKDGE